MRLPGSLRWRLTALYGGLFVLAGVTLTAITYVLVAGRLPRNGSLLDIPLPSIPDLRRGPQGVIQAIEDARAHDRSEALRQLITQSAIALGIVAVVAVLLGWLVAGRALRPIREITATARRLSTHNLDERINLAGPPGELKELADTFDAMLTRLSAAFEAQRRFAANVSHELRTPLTVQRAAIDVALADPSIESLQTMALRLRAANERQEHVIASLLTLARSQAGIERHESVDLATTVASAIDGAAGEIAERGIRVDRQLHLALLSGDPALLERLVANLVHNAVRHNEPGGWVGLDTGSDGRTVMLRVSNTGPVVPAERVGQLFEPFRRNAPDRTGAPAGYGLGLSIVSAITAAHGGSCTAQARPGGGLDVAIGLPVSGWQLAELLP